MMIFDVFFLDFMCQKARTFVNTDSHCCTGLLVNFCSVCIPLFFEGYVRIMSGRGGGGGDIKEM